MATTPKHRNSLLHSNTICHSVLHFSHNTNIIYQNSFDVMCGYLILVSWVVMSWSYVQLHSCTNTNHIRCVQSSVDFIGRNRATLTSDKMLPEMLRVIKMRAYNTSVARRGPMKSPELLPLKSGTSSDVYNTCQLKWDLQRSDDLNYNFLHT